MNGHVNVDVDIPADFVPSARPNGKSSEIVVVYIGPRSEVVLYSQEEALRYADAFMQAADLFDRQRSAVA